MIEGQDRRRSVTELLVALTGPAIWFAHFGSAYAIQGFGCAIAAGPAGWSHDIIWGAIIFVSVLAVTSLGMLLLYRYRRARADRSDANTMDEWPFLHYVQFAIAAIALVAVLWTTLAALLLPVCVPVFGS